jgi:hypothetical protein
VAQPGRYTIFRTDSAADFTAALAQNAGLFLNKNLPNGVGTAPFWVQSIEIISVENLAWELWFFNKTTVALAATDLDGFRGRWSFQAADGVRIAGAGNYHYSIDGLAIPVECSDYRLHTPDKYAQLHVALVNRSAAGKSADIAGAIVVQLALAGGLGGI